MKVECAILKPAVMGLLISLCITPRAGNSSHATAASLSSRPATAFAEHQSDPIQRGQIVERVICAKDSTQSYALYLPSSYAPDRQWPIVYALDPGARGSLPVNRFQAGAEKYGWIVAGSNNSRNGSAAQSLDAWKAMWEDTHRRFSVDDRRVYATGFSGGARTAILFAHLCGNCIAGVIASGAGLSSGLAPAEIHFTLFGTAGEDDFNFPELRNLDNALAKAGVTHLIEGFDGRHEWPPPAVATEAVEWMEIQAIKSGRRPRDDQLLDEVWKKWLAKAQTFAESDKMFEAYRAYASLADSFKGLRDVSEIERRSADLRDSRKVKDALFDERRQITKQGELEAQLNGAISERSNGENRFEADNRFREMITTLQQSAKGTRDIGDRRIARRVLEGLYVQRIEQGIDQLQRQNRYVEAALEFEIAAEIAPDRPGALFYLATAYALEGQKKNSLKALKRAVEKGFSDLTTILSTSAFDALREEPMYQEIIRSLRTAH
jgi:dienelactone hydrolase